MLLLRVRQAVSVLSRSMRRIQRISEKQCGEAQCASEREACASRLLRARGKVHREKKQEEKAIMLLGGTYGKYTYGDNQVP